PPTAIYTLSLHDALPILTLCRPVRGTATIERAPKARHAPTFTRRSVSASSQRTISSRRRHAPEKPEFGSRRTPASGAMLPADARSEEHTSELQSRFDLVC